MAKFDSTREISVRNEERIRSLETLLNQLRCDFENYKKNVQDEKKQKENSFLTKLTIVVGIIVAVITGLIQILL
ncbi:MAG: hypothetical protein J4400_05495 [Candidatus Aenigmarchaeota archaeon]|nr:hypothetical protein [Candidatus Aenigmarchaeota archaeon]